MKLSDIKNPEGKFYRRKAWGKGGVALLEYKRWMYQKDWGRRSPLVQDNKEANDWDICTEEEIKKHTVPCQTTPT